MRKRVLILDLLGFVCVYVIAFCKVHTLGRAEIVDKMNDLSVYKRATNM